MKIWLSVALALGLLTPDMASAQERQHIITMTGHGEADGRPDTAVLSAGVSVDAPTAAAALAASKASMQAVLAVVKNAGVSDKNMQTQNFSVHPQYVTVAGQGTHVSIRDPASLLARARADAVSDARNKAETFAKAAGVTLGPILSISEIGTEVLRPINEMPALARAGAEPVMEGEESIGANVTIVWEIK